MKTTTFTITRKDVEKLEKEYKRFDVRLTDNDNPIDLLCRYTNQWTLEEMQESNLEYYDQCLEAALEELDYETAFIAMLDEERRAHFRDNIKDYERCLERYAKGQRDYYAGEHDFDNAPTLDAEIQDKLDAFYDELKREWLYGDHRHSAGVLIDIAKELNLDDPSNHLDYDNVTGDIKLTLPVLAREEGEGPESKQGFLGNVADCIVDKIKAKRRKDAEQKEERLKQAAQRVQQEAMKKEERKKEIINKLYR